MRSRVIPGSSPTMARRCPVMRLKRVDLPTLGLPTMTTVGMAFGMKLHDSRGRELRSRPSTEPSNYYDASIPLSGIITTVVSAGDLMRTHKTIATIGVMLSSFALTLPAQNGRPEVTPAVNHDTSPPLRDMKVPPRSDVPRERPLRLIPGQA